jgi:CIC family chloride channel protein
MFQEKNLLGFPVLDKNDRLWGIVTLQDMERVLSQNVIKLRGLTAADVAVIEPVTVYPDEPIWTAIQKMAPRDLARLPVISRDGTGHLVGIISRSDILRAYDVAIVRKQRGKMLEKDVTLREEENNVFADLCLQNGDISIGKTLRTLKLPQDVNVVSVEREGVIIIPRGDTCFSVGDIVTVFGKKEVIRQVQEAFTGSGG